MCRAQITHRPCRSKSCTAQNIFVQSPTCAEPELCRAQIVQSPKCAEPKMMHSSNCEQPKELNFLRIDHADPDRAQPKIFLCRAQNVQSPNCAEPKGAEPKMCRAQNHAQPKFMHSSKNPTFAFFQFAVRNDSQAIQFIDSAAIVETEIIASVSSRFILLLELDLLRLLLARHAFSV